MENLQFPSTGYLRIKDIQKFLPISGTAWRKGVREGRFPKPVIKKNRYTAWRAEDIRLVIEQFPSIWNNLTA